MWTAAASFYVRDGADGGVVADLLPSAPLPPERSLWVNFEILPAEPGKPLPEALRQIESGRLQAEDAVVDGHSYRKTSVILPLANGDRREVILLLAEEGGRMRMLGFHRIQRHQEAPVGTTVVFQSGVPNPLTGVPAQVPADTYTYLALCTALASFGPDRPPLPAHLWLGDSAVPIEVTFDGKEMLDVLGTKVSTLRVGVRPRERRGTSDLLVHGDRAAYLRPVSRSRRLPGGQGRCRCRRRAAGHGFFRTDPHAVSQLSPAARAG